MPFCSISRKQSSSVFSAVTVTSSRVMISEVFIQAGHLFSAATLSDTSLCEITPLSLPLAFITPTERTCFSRRYCAARCTLVSSVIEKTSLRDPMRSDTFTGPSAGHSGRIVGLTQPGLQDEFQNIPGQNKTFDEKREERFWQTVRQDRMGAGLGNAVRLARLPRG